jgi:hypothetical protein
MSNTKNITREALSNFWGSQSFFRHWMARTIVFTEGCEFLNANHASWLVDAVISHVTHTPKVSREDFVVATLKVNLENKSAVLIFDDGNDNVLAKQEIEYTDFPLPEIVFYVENNGEGKTMMLTSER